MSDDILHRLQGKNADDIIFNEDHNKDWRPSEKYCWGRSSDFGVCRLRKTGEVSSKLI